MFRKLQVVEKGSDFAKATRITSQEISLTVDAGMVLVRNNYAGVNATDINFIQNRYGPRYEVPYDLGLEAMGQVCAVGAEVANVQVGDPVVVYCTGGYAEYQTVPCEMCLKVPSINPEYLAMNVSGLTAAVSIGEIGPPKPGQTALVTAAAGGTGNLAVQIFKNKYKCRVIGTCSSNEKAEFLRLIGCDVVIDYTTGYDDVLRQIEKAAPNGLDFVYECVGGMLRQVSLQCLAVHGKFILIGGISGYTDGSAWEERNGAPIENPLVDGKLLQRSASVNGFMLPFFREVIPHYFSSLLEMHQNGSLFVRCDPTAFNGIESVSAAVAYLHSGKSFGKVLVKLVDPV